MEGELGLDRWHGLRAAGSCAGSSVPPCSFCRGDTDCADAHCEARSGHFVEQAEVGWPCCACCCTAGERCRGVECCEFAERFDGDSGTTGSQSRRGNSKGRSCCGQRWDQRAAGGGRREASRFGGEFGSAGHGGEASGYSVADRGACVERTEECRAV